MAVELFEEHAAMLEAAEKFLAAIKRTPRPSIDEVNRLRMRLSSLIRQHSVTEDEHIYGPLMRQGGFDKLPELEPIVQKLRRQKAEYSEHIRKWTPQAIERDWEGYVAACEIRVAAFKRILRDEEASVYQAVLGLGPREMPTRLRR